MVSMGQPTNDKNKANPWSSMIKPVETVEVVKSPETIDPWEKMKEIQRKSNEEISKLIEESRKSASPTVYTTPKTEDSPKRTEDSSKRAPVWRWRNGDSPKRVDADSPWAGAPRSLWGKPKTSLRKLLPHSIIRLGTIALIGANILLGVAFVSTYTLSNILLFGYLLPSTAILIHYFMLMRYDDS
jgi:hypothetical protein